MTGATAAIDFAIDGKYNNDGAIALASIVEGSDYAIQGRALPFDAADIVPLKFIASDAGTYEISIDHLDGLFLDDQSIYVRDNQTGMVHDLKIAGYSFASEAGSFETRFELLFENALSVDQPSFNANSVMVYNQDGQVIVNSGNSMMEAIKIFDIRGRLLQERLDIAAPEAVFEIAADQVLIFRVTMSDGNTIIRKAAN
jgi:hypothetical protein